MKLRVKRVLSAEVSTPEAARDLPHNEEEAA